MTGCESFPGANIASTAAQIAGIYTMARMKVETEAQLTQVLSFRPKGEILSQRRGSYCSPFFFRAEKRHKIKDRGTGLRRFPHRDLYERYGLYKVSPGAGWHSEHASAWRTSESRVRENCTHGLMREDRREPVLYSTQCFTEALAMADQPAKGPGHEPASLSGGLPSPPVVLYRIDHRVSQLGLDAEYREPRFCEIARTLRRNQRYSGAEFRQGGAVRTA